MAVAILSLEGEGEPKEREGGREGERKREVGAEALFSGIHYLNDRRLSTAGLQEIIYCRTVLMSLHHALTVSMVGFSKRIQEII
jgi:hypothetical protein